MLDRLHQLEIHLESDRNYREHLLELLEQAELSIDYNSRVEQLELEISLDKVDERIRNYVIEIEKLERG